MYYQDTALLLTLTCVHCFPGEKVKLMKMVCKRYKMTKKTVSQHLDVTGIASAVKISLLSHSVHFEF